MRNHGLLLLAGCTFCVATQAADRENAAYPKRPIRMVISNGPGSAGDMLGRIAFIRTANIRIGCGKY